MSDIVADAKAWLSGRDNGTLRTHSENCHQWHTECLMDRLIAEVERHRMTPEERVVVADAADIVEAYDSTSDDPPSIGGQAIRNYLDRTAPKET